MAVCHRRDHNLGLSFTNPPAPPLSLLSLILFVLNRTRRLAKVHRQVLFIQTPRLHRNHLDKGQMMNRVVRPESQLPGRRTREGHFRRPRFQDEICIQRMIQQRNVLLTGRKRFERLLQLANALFRCLHVVFVGTTPCADIVMNLVPFFVQAGNRSFHVVGRVSDMLAQGAVADKGTGEGVEEVGALGAVFQD